MAITEPMSLAAFSGYLTSWSAYEKYMKLHPRSQILKELEERLASDCFTKLKCTKLADSHVWLYKVVKTRYAVVQMMDLPTPLFKHLLHITSCFRLLAVYNSRSSQKLTAEETQVVTSWPVFMLLGRKAGTSMQWWRKKLAGIWQQPKWRRNF